MALGRDHRNRASDRWQRALLVVGNVLPLAAYAYGSLPFLEALLVYLLEPPIVGLVTTVKLATVQPPAGERDGALLSIDRRWLARPLRVTRWNLRRAARHGLGYGAYAALGYGLVAAVLVSLADAASTIPGFEATTLAAIALLAVGVTLGRLRDLALFVLGHDGRRADHEALLERSDLERRRLVLLAFVYAVVGLTGLTLLGAVPGLALLVVVALKTGVDLLFQAEPSAAS